jgi:curved DNA-binding protein CbpA
MSRDYYEILQLGPDATTEEVQKAYRALALRFHPDRNPTPEAASTMQIINEAYSVIGEPSRRLVYDRERRLGASKGIAQPVLRAAYEALLKQGWIVTANDGVNLVLEQGTRAVRVSLVERLDNAGLRKLGRQFAGFTMVLALQIETPINLSFHIGVIDLMRCRRHGAEFPDDVYRALFAPFLAA